jgi:hypothetical protein
MGGPSTAVESSVPGGRPGIAAGPVGGGEAEEVGEASGVGVAGGAVGVQAVRKRIRRSRKAVFFIG